MGNRIKGGDKVRRFGSRDGVQFGFTIDINVNRAVLGQWADLGRDATEHELNEAIDAAIRLGRLMCVPIRWAKGDDYQMVWFSIWSRESCSGRPAGDWYVHVWHLGDEEPQNFIDVLRVQEAIKEAMVSTARKAKWIAETA